MANENPKFVARHVLLTYAQCPLDEELVLEAVRMACAVKDWDIVQWVSCMEWHRDGFPHVHIALKFSAKIQTREWDIFDVVDVEDVYHPNWRAGVGKKAWFRLSNYCRKGGQYHEDHEEFPNDPTNYVKVKRDNNEWKDDAKARNPLPAFPFSLPDGKAVGDPGKYCRRYIYIVRGTPDSGKSYWRKSSLKPGTYFLVNKDYRYPMEGYAGERIIVYDDWEDEKEKRCITSTMLIANGEVEPMRVSVGPVRYTTTYYPPNVQRVVILVCNDPPACIVEERIQTRVAVDLRMQDVVIDLSQE